MLRFLHTADWQIGRAFSFAQGDAAPRLRQARVDVIDRIAAAALEREALFVLVAGDVFDAEALSNATLRAPLERMQRLPQITWYLLPGNHDPDRRDGIWDRLAHLDLPPNVRPVRRSAPMSLADGVSLLPCPLTARAVANDPTAWLEHAATPQGELRIGLAHGSIRDFGESQTAMRAAIAPDRAERAGLDYLALGDWHRTQRITPRAWYSGTPEPDGFGGNGDVLTGSVLAVSIAAPGALPVVEPVPVSQFAWVELQTALYESADIAALESRARAMVPDPAFLHLRLRLTGSLDMAGQAQFETRIGEALRAAVLALDLDSTSLVAKPTTDDMDLLDAPGSVLRTAAERLAGEAATDDSAMADKARRALAILFDFARRNSPQGSADKNLADDER